MTFDFYANYKDYTTLQLLGIIRQPGEYQPEAVAAATKILGEREVTEEEVKLIDEALQDMAFAKRYESEKFGRLKAKAAELFPPVFQPQEKIEPSKWLNFLLLVIGIEYVWMLFESGEKMIRIFSRGNFYWVDFLDLLPIFYTPVIFYLLFRKRRWGWILLFADNLGSLIMLLSESYIFFKYQSFHHGSTTTFITQILIRSAFAVFLWRDAIVDLFAVNPMTKKRTVWITTAGTLFFIGAVYLL
ncbi:MAG TPA: hypothetical protein VGS79_27870 [Puia sp.]|nr:hypothetical protein [Puia sp.]